MPVQFSECQFILLCIPASFNVQLYLPCLFPLLRHHLHIPLMYGGVSVDVNFGQLPIQSLFLLLFTFVDTSIQYVQFNTHSVSHDLSFMDLVHLRLAGHYSPKNIISGFAFSARFNFFVNSKQKPPYKFCRFTVTNGEILDFHLTKIIIRLKLFRRFYIIKFT